MACVWTHPMSRPKRPLHYIIQQLYLEEIPSQPFSELAGQQYIIHSYCVRQTNKTIFLNAVSMENHFVFASILGGGAVFSKNSN